MSVDITRGRTNVCAALLSITLVNACDRATHTVHSFTSSEMEAGRGASVAVNAYGTWQSVLSGDSTIFVSGSPYVLEVRVGGVSSAVQLGALVIRNSASGESVTVADWDSGSFDRSDSAWVFALRRGIQIAPGDKRVSGVLRVENGADSLMLHFDGVLTYALKVDRRSRLLERLRGI